MTSAMDLVAAARARINEVDVNAAEAAIARADVVIDVREGDEFRQGHIHGAVHIPRGLLEFLLDSKPELQSRELNVVLYCKSSGRAALAAASMQDMGYRHVQSIIGGYDAWAAAGKPVNRPAAPDFG